MSDLLRVYFEEDRTGTSTKNMLEREHTNKLIHVWYSCGTVAQSRIL